MKVDSLDRGNQIIKELEALDRVDKRLEPNQGFQQITVAQINSALNSALSSSDELGQTLINACKEAIQDYTGNKEDELNEEFDKL